MYMNMQTISRGLTSLTIFKINSTNEQLTLNKINVPVM